MAGSQISKNPFYFLLVVVGVMFAVTAFAYGVMTLHAIRISGEPPVATAGSHPLLVWLGSHGDYLLLGEIAALGLLTFAAIGTDDFWERKNGQPENGVSNGEL